MSNGPDTPKNDPGHQSAAGTGKYGKTPGQSRPEAINYKFNPSKWYSPGEWYILLVRIYQLIVSPWLPKCCRFEPNCSRYSIEAIRIHGLLKGVMLTVWRLLRCQPFCKGGYDPVPPPKHWRRK